MSKIEQLAIIVTGGHDNFDDQHVFNTLDEIRKTCKRMIVIEGGAAGVDTAARKWAESNADNLITERAKWKKYGNAAGPRRNHAMLQLLLRYHEIGYTVQVVAFRGNDGTANMVKLAHEAHVRVVSATKPLTSPGLFD